MNWIANWSRPGRWRYCPQLARRCSKVATSRNAVDLCTRPLLLLMTQL
jgi:hypothetical protein